MMDGENSTNRVQDHKDYMKGCLSYGDPHWSLNYLTQYPLTSNLLLVLQSRVAAHLSEKLDALCRNSTCRVSQYKDEFP